MSARGSKGFTPDDPDFAAIWVVVSLTLQSLKPKKRGRAWEALMEASIIPVRKADMTPATWRGRQCLGEALTRWREMHPD